MPKSTQAVVPHNHLPLSPPAWAEDSRLFPDTDDLHGVAHSWTSPRLAEVIVPGEPGRVRVSAEIYQRDDLELSAAGVWLTRGLPYIFLHPLDVSFDVEQARLLAAALIECCDRIDGAQATAS